MLGDLKIRWILGVAPKVGEIGVALKVSEKVSLHFIPLHAPARQVKRFITFEIAPKLVKVHQFFYMILEGLKKIGLYMGT